MGTGHGVSDVEAKLKLRRLRHWADLSIRNKSISFISDEISLRLEDHDWALKKHGIKTLTGTLSDLLDPKVLIAAGAAAGSLTLAGADFWAAVGAAGILVGRAALSVTTMLMDRAELRRNEIAVIHEIKSLGKAP